MDISPEIAIEFAGVTYGVTPGRAILSGVDLAIRRGETMMLVGESGSGKTTCLKMINRLLLPSRGQVRVEGRSTAEWEPIRLRRRIGYAIQEVGLFPHYTVEQNIGLLPKLEAWSCARIKAQVEETLRLAGLPPETFARRYPDQLSGGQRQRVGLARALAADPPILLMDEPFGALDPITRLELQREFRRLQQQLAKTVIFVTHDVTEAMLLGDRIALLAEGAVHGVYQPAEFATSPDPRVCRYVAAFRQGQELLRPGPQS
jgi:osmoprotectant transport system ATP-binding protein